MKLIVLGFIACASLNLRAMPAMYTVAAQEHRVPTKLFYALILNESKSRVTTGNRQLTLPWPWTINHRGTPHFFETKKEAHTFMLSLISEGDFQFDVGLGQINWRWHRQHFKDPWSALDPFQNLNHAARYLRSQYERDECNSWELAVGCYHRPGQRIKDKRIATNYRRRVIKLWKNLSSLES